MPLNRQILNHFFLVNLAAQLLLGRKFLDMLFTLNDMSQLSQYQLRSPPKKHVCEASRRESPPQYTLKEQEILIDRKSTKVITEGTIAHSIDSSAKISSKSCLPLKHAAY